MIPQVLNARLHETRVNVGKLGDLGDVIDAVEVGQDLQMEEIEGNCNVANAFLIRTC